MSKRTPHTACHPGKLVRVKLRDGTMFTDRFKERTGQFVVFDNHKVEGRRIDQFRVIKK